MSERGSGLILIVMGMVVLLCFVAGIYLLSSSKNSSPNQPNQKSNSKSVEQEKLTPTYETRQFDPKSLFFADVNYPDEVLYEADSDLLGMSCTVAYRAKQYGDSLDQFSYWDKSTNKEIKPSNMSVINLFEDLNDPTGKISEFQYCIGEEGSYLISYHNWISDDSSETGWERGSDPNFLYIKTANEKSRIITIKNSDDFFDDNCWMLLQFSKKGIAYFQCGNYGKMPYQESYIYKVDFNKRSSELVTHCVQEPKEAGFSFDPNSYKFDPAIFSVSCSKK